MRGVLTIVLLGLLTAPRLLRAVPEDDSRVVTGEMEETTDILPEILIPWHDSLLELPEWMSLEAGEISNRRRPANHGAGLFPPEVWPIQPEPVLGPLIRDEALAVTPTPRRRGGTITAVALGAELMELYAGSPPDGVLVNPQNLVPNDRVEPLVQRWLNDQCVFRTTILLFGGGQQLPAGFDPQALRRGWFGAEGEELLVFYFLGEPQRTLAIFGPQANSSYGRDLLRSVVDAAVAEAARVSGGQEQLERFCYKMSVRLHWLARTAPGMAVAAQGTADGAGHSGSLKRAATAALVAAGLIAIGILSLTWYRRRAGGSAAAADRVPVFLPEIEFKPRFGAPQVVVFRQ